MLENRTRVAVGLLSSALTRSPVPGVESTAPRRLVTLKKSPGNGLGSAAVSGTPSQLISRLPPLNGPVPGACSTPPSETAVRKLSTADWMSAGVAPDAEVTTGAAKAPGAKPRASAIGMESRGFFIDVIPFLEAPKGT